jgi:hypothetical protein
MNIMPGTYTEADDGIKMRSMWWAEPNSDENGVYAIAL